MLSSSVPFDPPRPRVLNFVFSSDVALNLTLVLPREETAVDRDGNDDSVGETELRAGKVVGRRLTVTVRPRSPDVEGDSVDRALDTGRRLPRFGRRVVVVVVVVVTGEVEEPVTLLSCIHLSSIKLFIQPGS